MSDRLDAHAALVDILNALDRVTNPERSATHAELYRAAVKAWEIADKAVRQMECAR